MVRDLCAATGAQVTADANLNRHLPLGQYSHEFGILNGVEPVANALSADIERAPDRFRPEALPRMGGQTQAAIARAKVSFLELLGKAASFVAANADARDAGILLPQLNGFIHHASDCVPTEVAHSINNPQQRNSEIAFAALAAAFQPFENRR